VKDLFLITGCLGVCLVLLILAAALIDRAKDQRPYLAARWDDKAGDWANQAEHDVGPDPLRLLTDLEAHLKAYGAEIADLYEPATTDQQTGDQPS
jgi:hypothetical protein